MIGGVSGISGSLTSAVGGTSPPVIGEVAGRARDPPVHSAPTKISGSLTSAVGGTSPPVIGEVAGRARDPPVHSAPTKISDSSPLP